MAVTRPNRTHGSHHSVGARGHRLSQRDKYLAVGGAAAAAVGVVVLVHREGTQPGNVPSPTPSPVPLPLPTPLPGNQLPAPAHAHAQTVTSVDARIVWDAVSGAISYHVLDATGVAITTTAQLHALVSGLSPGTRYHLSVVAVGNDGRPGRPALVSFTTLGTAGVRNPGIMELGGGGGGGRHR